jgi:hypothetical protein
MKLKIEKREEIGRKICVGDITNQGLIIFEKGFSGEYFSNGKQTFHQDGLVVYSYYIVSEGGDNITCSKELQNFIFEGNLEEIDSDLVIFKNVNDKGQEVPLGSYDVFDFVADLKQGEFDLLYVESCFGGFIKINNRNINFTETEENRFLLRKQLRNMLESYIEKEIDLKNLFYHLISYGGEYGESVKCDTCGDYSTEINLKIIL